MIAHGEHTSVHFFSGGCGDMRGFTDAGFRSLYAANHHKASVRTAEINWPGIRVHPADLQNVDMRCVPRARVLVGSPICTEASPNSGKAAFRAPVELDAAGRPTAAASGRDWPMTRITMWEPVRYAEVHQPWVYCWENVPEFGYGPLFAAWLHVWDVLGKGYVPVVASVNAAHLKAGDGGPLPQSRDRLVGAFVRKDIADAYGLPDLNPTCDAVCDRCGPVEGVQHWKSDPPLRVGSYGRRRQYVYVCPDCRTEVDPVVRGIGDVLEDVPGEPLGLGYYRGRQRTRRTHYKQGTRDRVAIGLERYRGAPFVVTLRNHCDASSLDEPIGTLSAQGGGHHYLARPTADLTVDSVEYRPLNLREKARCQGFPDHHEFAGTEADQRLQIGNAVPVNVATWQARRIAARLPGGPGTAPVHTRTTVKEPRKETA